MADTKMKEFLMGAAEIVATHQVMKHVKAGDDQEPLRIITGAGMGALGFMYGPDLYERIKKHDYDLSTKFSRDIAYATGGAIGGGLIGYLVGPKFGEGTSQAAVPANVKRAIESAKPKEGVVEKPSGLIFTASAGWLAYALLFNGKSDEQRIRHQLMLGAGAIGYAYGPEFLTKTKDIIVSKNLVNDSLDRYNKAVALCTIGGGLLGYYKGADFADNWRNKNDKDPKGGR